MSKKKLDFWGLSEHEAALRQVQILDFMQMIGCDNPDFYSLQQEAIFV
jgi:hypothetical protein